MLGVLPAIVIALGEGLWVVVQVIIGTVIVQQIESDLISPNVIGKKLDIHPLTIIVLVMLAITIFGIIGAFMVVPTYAAFRASPGCIIGSTKTGKRRNIVSRHPNPYHPLSTNQPATDFRGCAIKQRRCGFRGIHPYCIEK